MGVIRDPHVGGWGGSCTCPNGSVYQVSMVSVELAIDAMVRGREKRSFAAPQTVETCSTTWKVPKVYHQKKLYQKWKVPKVYHQKKLYEKCKRTYCSCYDNLILE